MYNLKQYDVVTQTHYIVIAHILASSHCTLSLFILGTNGCMRLGLGFGERAIAMAMKQRSISTVHLLKYIV